jgi:dihydrofolate reductase
MMSKLIVSTLVTVDGVYGDPQAWAPEHFDEEATKESLDVLLESEGMLMGRGTYEYFAPTWAGGEGPYLARLNEIPKYVFSSTLTSADWNNSTIVADDALTAVRELKQRLDRDLIIYGYGRLAQTLLEHELVDELWIAIHPVVLGQGASLFRPGDRVNLELASVTQRPNGVVKLSYRHA